MCKCVVQSIKFVELLFCCYIASILGDLTIKQQVFAEQFATCEQFSTLECGQKNFCLSSEKDVIYFNNTLQPFVVDNKARIFSDLECKIPIIHEKTIAENFLSFLNQCSVVLKAEMFPAILIGWSSSKPVNEGLSILMDKGNYAKAGKIDFLINNIHAGIPYVLDDLCTKSDFTLGFKILGWAISHGVRLSVMEPDEIRPGVPGKWTVTDYALRIPTGAVGALVGDTLSREVQKKIYPYFKNTDLIILLVDFGSAALVRELPRQIYKYKAAGVKVAGKETVGDIIIATTYFCVGHLLRGESGYINSGLAFGAGVVGGAMYDGVISLPLGWSTIFVASKPIVYSVLPDTIQDMLSRHEDSLKIGFYGILCVSGVSCMPLYIATVYTIVGMGADLAATSNADRF